MQSRINNSFRPRGIEAFISVTEFAGDPAPPYIVADIAQNRLVDAEALELPNGYTNQTFDIIKGMTGQVGREIGVSLRQGRELRALGQQILELDDNDLIRPPLAFEETMAIRRLVTVVSATESVIANRS